ncbi:hypothetical protein MY10362_002847 [Beauveria mimosiformis]
MSCIPLPLIKIPLASKINKIQNNHFHCKFCKVTPPTIGPSAIHISRDAKRTKNRLAQRRRRGMYSLVRHSRVQPLTTLYKRKEEAAGNKWKADNTAAILGDERGPSAEAENVQLDTPASLNSWCATSSSIEVSSWLDAAAAAPVQDSEQPEPLYLLDDYMVQANDDLLLDPLLSSLDSSPSSTQPSSSHGQAVNALPSACLSPPVIGAQKEVEHCEEAIRSNSGETLRRSSMTSSSISPTGASRPSSASFTAPDLAESTLNHPKLINLAAEKSIARILVLAEEMGFESFDDLATTYYTGTFSESSLPRYAQSTSRSRRLRSLLMGIHASSRDWVGREARGYEDGQRQLLETVCIEELNAIRAGDGQTTHNQRQCHRTQDFITNMIKQLFTFDRAEQLLEKDRQLLKEQVSSSAVAQTKRAP